MLSTFGIKDGTILLCDDFMQKFELRLIIVNWFVRLFALFLLVLYNVM